MEEGRQRQGSRQKGRHSNESIKEETRFILILQSSSSSNLKPIIGPRSEFHHTGLLIERKVLDVNHAGRLVDGRRLPLDEAVEPQRGLRRQSHLEISVGARFGKGFVQRRLDHCIDDGARERWGNVRIRKGGGPAAKLSRA